MKKYYYLGCLLLLVFSACSKGPKDKVVLQVGSDKMTLENLEERFRDAPPTLRGYLNTKAGRKQFMDLLLRERTVIESAKKAGYIKKDEYKEALEGFKEDQSRRLKEYEESLLVELFVKDLHEAQFSSSEEDVEKYYNDHMSEYDKPKEIMARHILVATQEEAEKVLSRAKEGEDFAALAKDVSVDPISSGRGGEIGPFKKGDLIPEFEKAVFPMKVGQISDVVETQFGYHVIKKVDEKNLPSRSLEDSKDEIKRILEKEKFDAWLEVAKEKHKVEVDYDALSMIAQKEDEQQEVAQQEAAQQEAE